MVTALGAINTERPKITAASIKERFPGKSTGNADPKAMQLKIMANGRPEAWRARMGRHTKGETRPEAFRFSKYTGVNWLDKLSVKG